MSLVSDNSTPMEKEVAVDFDGNIAGSVSSPPPSPNGFLISEEEVERRVELYRGIRRLIVADPDLFFFQPFRYEHFSKGRRVDASVVDQFRALEIEEKPEDFDVEGGGNKQMQYFQRNALFASGTAFMTLGGTVTSAILTTDFENKSSHSKALAKSLCISSIALGLSGTMVGILAFRCGHRRLPLASSIFYTSGLVTAAILVAFGILAVIGI